MTPNPRIAMHALARSLRAAALAAVCLSTIAVSGCRGRNDGGLDAAGSASNGAGPAPQPGPLGGQSTDTTTAPPGTPAATGGAAPGTSATGPVPAASAAGATKRP